MNNEKITIAPLRLSALSQNGAIRCDLYGGTAEQLRFLLRARGLVRTSTTALEEALEGVGDGRDRLLLAIGHPNPWSRVWYSQELLRDLWRADRGLGPYPLLDLLAEAENEKASYPAHRDHLA